VTFVFFVVEIIFVVSIRQAARTFPASAKATAGRRSPKGEGWQVRDTEIILLVEIAQRLHVVG
jgi:hypothetical protein